MTDSRYQNQSWLVRRWRDRWLLLVPYWTFRWWVNCRRLPSGDPWQMPVADWWSLALGHCDVRRNWIYTWSEAESREWLTE